ncbi:MAG TPA: aminotransferase class V-fold PLP-dependent enzyme, partial [Ignavibacteria bacterium]|nr:aminotransferase class V-fold PLP-dependent enzyme [Ignavibacteria bacterium]
GGHEKGFRSGTLNVPGIVGLGKACELAKTEFNDYDTKVRIMRDDLENKLLEIGGSWINGDKNKRVPNILNIGFNGVDSDVLLAGLKRIAISKGSACSSDSVKPSHVLKAMGLNDKEAYSSLRFSLGKFNSFLDITKTISILKGYLLKNKETILYE